MPQHTETRRMPYRADQMYDLVADVENYPEFLPWTAAARIRSNEDKGDHTLMLADLIISFRVFRERFTSQVRLFEDDRRIETEYVDGPFKRMKSIWQFREIEDNTACEVTFDVDFEFRNAILRAAAGVFFNDAMQRIVRAFERRAEVLYGGSTGT